MTRILAYATSGIGHLYPMVPLLSELRGRGHEVHLRTMQSQLELMAGLGFEVSAVDERIARTRLPDWEARHARESLEITVEVFVQRAAYDGPDLQDAIARTQPDVLVVDSAAWGACFAAERWGGPWVRFSPFTPPMGEAGVPPYGLGMTPRAGLLGQLRDASLRPFVVGELERAFAPRLNEMRRTYGLHEVHTAAQLHLTSDLLMVTSAEPFEYHHPDWPDTVMMVGPMAWDPPVRRPQWLDDLEGPLALVTTSSEYQADEKLPTMALEALADQPLTVVATMPAGLDRRIAVPPNGRLAEFVPHGPVLDRCVVAVTHAGLGVTQKALVRGVPVCAVPFGRDQPEVAARLVHAGAGTRLRARRLSVESLRRGVFEAMSKVEVAMAVGEQLARHPGAPAAATAVEALVHRS